MFPTHPYTARCAIFSLESLVVVKGSARAAPPRAPRPRAGPGGGRRGGSARRAPPPSRVPPGGGGGAPAVTVDRYGDFLVAHLYSGAIEPLFPALLDALEATFRPKG